MFRQHILSFEKTFFVQCARARVSILAHEVPADAQHRIELQQKLVWKSYKEKPLLVYHMDIAANNDRKLKVQNF